jgi:hypothetical protein
LGVLNDHRPARRCPSLSHMHRRRALLWAAL